jgi:hypothetical protein
MPVFRHFPQQNSGTAGRTSEARSGIQLKQAFPDSSLRRTNGFDTVYESVKFETENSELETG